MSAAIGSAPPAIAVSDRIATADWVSAAAGLDEVGAASVGRVLDETCCAALVDLYDTGRFRSTVDMARHRFGSGQYRYFAPPLPAVVGALREAFWPHLLPIARAWADRQGRPAPWPDELEAWLAVCHQAGQTRPTPLLLRYGPGDWNALHRDVYGDLVFPLQVVIGLKEPDVDYSGGEFTIVEQRPRGAVAGDGLAHRARRGGRVHDSRPAGPQRSRLVERARPPRRERRPVGPTPRPRPDLPRRCVTTEVLTHPRRPAVEPASPMRFCRAHERRLRSFAGQNW